ncbi:DUF58 domain-containing protein [Paenibacillus sp. CAU 1782]
MIFVWFILAAGAVLFAQNRLFKVLVLSRLSYTRRFRQKQCFCGDEVQLVEELRNEKWLPVPWLRAESLLPSSLRFRKSDNFDVSSGQYSQNHRSFFSLAPYTKLTRTHTLTAAKRGKFKLETVTLSGGDLLGNGERTFVIPLKSELTVYPLPLLPDLGDLPSHSWQGEHSVRRYIAPDPFVVVGARPYRSGDTMKSVDWKATARTGELQVHQYDYTADTELMVFLNVESGKGMWRAVTDEELIETGISWAAGAVGKAIAGGMSAGFASNMPQEGMTESPYIKPSGGQEHLYRMLDLMAGLQMQRTEAFVEVLRRAETAGTTSQDMLIISTFWDETLEQAAARLRYNGNAVTVWMLEGKGGAHARGK